ncbi:hypothetical protein TNCV_3346871 [Trichonephila clavipes]|nr:hypothetical protein TNCV_3346871 [Trichonephila clavipes]
MTPCGRSCHSICICAVNSPVSRDGCSCLPSVSRHALLAKDLVTWQAMVGRHILEDIVGESRNTCAVVISTETESGFITEDDTSPVCHTPKLPEVGKNPVDTAYDVGSVVSVLADVGSSPTSVSRLLYGSLDGTGREKLQILHLFIKVASRICITHKISTVITSTDSMANTALHPLMCQRDNPEEIK